MSLLYSKYYCQEMACKTAAWYTPYSRILLLLCVYTTSAVADTMLQPSKWQILPAQPSIEEPLTLSLKAEKAVKGWMSTSIPVLTIQCAKGSAAVYVETGMALEVTMVDQQIVRLQLDGNKPFPQRWREVTNATVSARDATALVKQLTQSQKFIFEFTPFNGTPTQAEFSVTGLSAYLPKLAKACWKEQLS